MINDWQNNFTSIYAELTRQQEESKNYMEEYMSRYSQISVTGHSLGGNLALAVAVITNESIRNKITSSVTFNAPGFNSEFVETYREQIQRESHKKINMILSHPYCII
jgi:esterase/lipase